MQVCTRNNNSLVYREQPSSQLIHTSMDTMFLLHSHVLLQSTGIFETTSLPYYGNSSHYTHSVETIAVQFITVCAHDKENTSLIKTEKFVRNQHAGEPRSRECGERTGEQFPECVHVLVDLRLHLLVLIDSTCTAVDKASTSGWSSLQLLTNKTKISDYMKTPQAGNKDVLIWKHQVF